MNASRRVAGQPNLVLRNRLRELGMSEQAFAARSGIDVKTIQRWLNGETTPQMRNAVKAASVLDLEPSQIWPDTLPVMDPPSAGTVPVSTYDSRAAVPIQVWSEHFAGANEQIDVLVYGGTFLFDALRNFGKLLAQAVDQGAKLRFLVGDQTAIAIRQRGEEEGIDESLAERCRLTLTWLRKIALTVPMDVRIHHTTLYVSMFRADDTLIANHHILGLPASDNPAFVIDRSTAPDLFAKYENSFNDIWADADFPAKWPPALTAEPEHT